LEQAQKEGQKSAGLSKQALAALMDYSWPGNVRELQNALHFALVKSRGRIIQPVDLPIEFQYIQRTASVPGPARKLDPDSVAAAIKRSGGNKSKAARLLGVGRATLYRFLEDFPGVS